MEGFYASTRAIPQESKILSYQAPLEKAVMSKLPPSTKSKSLTSGVQCQKTHVRLQGGSSSSGSRHICSITFSNMCIIGPGQDLPRENGSQP